METSPMTEIAERPKDMTPAELEAPPLKDSLMQPPNPRGLNGDDLDGYWQDRDGKWWREPPMFL